MKTQLLADYFAMYFPFSVSEVKSVVRFVAHGLQYRYSTGLTCGHISALDKDLFPAVVCFHNIEGSYGWWGS